MSAVLDYLPRGNTLSDDTWQHRHQLLQGLLALHLPLLFAFGLLRDVGPAQTAEALAVPLACLVLGRVLRSRRPASLFITAGLVYCSAALVGFSDGAIEAHFHFFIIIGFIALYQDWVPFLLNILFTVLSHGIGSSFVPDLMFNHVAAQNQPWTWSLIHGVAVLAACVGVVLFWRTTEEEQKRSLQLTEELTAAELSRRRFTSDLLVNLARRNQNLLHRQLSLLNQLEDKEHDPDALADLFRLDHLATRIRRNAESLLVLSGEESPRTWRGPVPLVDVVRAAIAEIEDLDRVDFAVDESLAVSGRGVADLTHLLAELLENAVRFSPPGVTVMLRSRPYQQSPGAQVITIEDWGVGMTPAELADANDLLRRPRDVDLSVSQRLGLHVVARLAHRYGISVELTATPGGGVTAVVLLPRGVFTAPGLDELGPASPPARPAEPSVERGGRPDGPPSAVLPVESGSGPERRGASAPERRQAPAPDRRPVPTPAAAALTPAAAVPAPERRPEQRPAAAAPSLAAASATPATPVGAAPAAAPAASADGGGNGLRPLPRRAPGSALRRDETTGTPTARPAGATRDLGGDGGWSSWWDRPAADAGPPPRRAADLTPPPRLPADDVPPLRRATDGPPPLGRPAADGLPVHRSDGPALGRPAGDSLPVHRADGPALGRPAGDGLPVHRADGPPPSPRRPIDDVPPLGRPMDGPSPLGRPADDALPLNRPAGGPPPLGRPAEDALPLNRPAGGPPPLGRPADDALPPGRPTGGPPPLARPAGDAPAGGGGATLARRVPQANLAAGLRRAPTPAAPTEPAALRDPAAARDALSRFQASQRAARASVDEEVTR